MVPRNTLEKSLMSKFLGTTDIASFALLDSSISLHLGTMDTLSLHLGTTDTLCTGLHNTVCLWFLGTTDSNWEPWTNLPHEYSVSVVRRNYRQNIDFESSRSVQSSREPWTYTSNQFLCLWFLGTKDMWFLGTTDKDIKQISGMFSVQSS